MRIAVAALLVLAAAPALAQEVEPAQRPITDRTVTATDVATTPVTDLNLRKQDIPEVLIVAQERPYDLSGIRRCREVIAAVSELDAALGDDIDLGPREQKGPSAGKLAQWLVGSFIPFRGAIREISGANEQQRRVQAAIEAGIARRSFLKGYGQARGCRYPARAITPDALAARAAQGASPAPAEAEAAPAQPRKSSRRRERGIRYVEQPVIQPTG